MTTARTRWMLGLKVRFVRLFEWETLCPVRGPLPHTSHRLAIGFTSEGEGRESSDRKTVRL